MRKREADFTIEQKIKNREFGYNTEAIIDCYDSVQSEIEILLNQLNNQDKQIRIASTYAISWFPEEANKSLPKLIDSINQSNDETAFACEWKLLLFIQLCSRAKQGKSN